MAVSPSSRSGKTETAKIILAFLTDAGFGSELSNQIMQSYLVLEALSHARTPRNPNSSRVGKFTALELSLQSPANDVLGQTLFTFLLEDSRVLGGPSEETQGTNFHIFYALLASPDHEHYLLSNDPGRYAILGAGERPRRGDDGDLRGAGRGAGSGPPETGSWIPPGSWYPAYAEIFDEFIEACHALQMPDDDVDGLLGVVAGILHLGNLKFASTSSQDEDAACRIKTADVLEAAAEVLRVDRTELEQLLVSRGWGAEGRWSGEEGGRKLHGPYEALQRVAGLSRML